MSSRWDAGPIAGLAWAARVAGWAYEDAEKHCASIQTTDSAASRAAYHEMWDRRRALDEAWANLISAADKIDGAAS